MEGLTELFKLVSAIVLFARAIVEFVTYYPNRDSGHQPQHLRGRDGPEHPRRHDGSKGKRLR